MKAEEKAGGHLGNDPRFFAKLSGAVALAFANRRNGPIVGIDNFTVGQRLALNQAAGLLFNELMGVHRLLQSGVQTGFLRRAQCPLLVQIQLCRKGERNQRFPDLE